MSGTSNTPGIVPEPPVSGAARTAESHRPSTGRCRSSHRSRSSRHERHAFCRRARRARTRARAARRAPRGASRPHPGTGHERGGRAAGRVSAPGSAACTPASAPGRCACAVQRTGRHAPAQHRRRDHPARRRRLPGHARGRQGLGHAPRPGARRARGRRRPRARRLPAPRRARWERPLRAHACSRSCWSASAVRSPISASSRPRASSTIASSRNLPADRPHLRRRSSRPRPARSPSGGVPKVSPHSRSARRSSRRCSWAARADAPETMHPRRDRSRCGKRRRGRPRLALAPAVRAVGQRDRARRLARRQRHCRHHGAERAGRDGRRPGLVGALRRRDARVRRSAIRAPACASRRRSVRRARPGWRRSPW